MRYLYLFLLLVSQQISAQLTLNVTSIPNNTPVGSTIYIAGNFNNWNPQKDTLTKLSNGSFQIKIAASIGTVEYKFTRGSWATVEGSAQGGFVPNRKYVYNGGNVSTNLTIEGWEGQAGNASTATANVTQILNFEMPQLNKKRRIWVYLPTDYTTSTASYPVLYLQDGQNLFDKTTSFSGEWKVDEAMNELIKNGGTSAIVVGIDNGGAERMAEYTPWSNPKYGGGAGKTYMKFIVETLKPYIDKQYRTLADRENTAIGGSSLGGLESFYGAMEYQNIFSKGMIFSPSFWWNTNCFQHVIDTGKKANMRFYLLAGGNEEPDDDVITQAKKMENTLLSKGFLANEIKAYYPEYGQHNEVFWSNEFKAAYQWLFQKTTATLENSVSVFDFFPNPANDSLTITHDFGVDNLMFQIININGQVVGNQMFMSKKETINIQHLPKGTYKILMIKADTKSILGQKSFMKS